MSLSDFERKQLDTIDEAVQRFITADPEDSDAVVTEWVIAVCVQVVDPETGIISTGYRRVQPNQGRPTHHITGLLDIVSHKEAR